MSALFLGYVCGNTPLTVANPSLKLTIIDGFYYITHMC